MIACKKNFPLAFDFNLNAFVVIWRTTFASRRHSSNSNTLDSKKLKIFRYGFRNLSSLRWLATVFLYRFQKKFHCFTAVCKKWCRCAFHTKFSVVITIRVHAAFYFQRIEPNCISILLFCVFVFSFFLSRFSRFPFRFVPFLSVFYFRFVFVTYLLYKCSVI